MQAGWLRTNGSVMRERVQAKHIYPGVLAKIIPGITGVHQPYLNGHGSLIRMSDDAMTMEDMVSSMSIGV